MYDNYDYPSLCAMFNLQSLQSRRKVSDLCFFNKILTNNINCPYIVGEISLNVPSRVLRYKPTFNISFRLQCRKTSFILRVMEMANRLDLYDTLIMNEPVVFKRFIKDFITQFFSLHFSSLSRILYMLFLYSLILILLIIIHAIFIVSFYYHLLYLMHSLYCSIIGHKSVVVVIEINKHILLGSVGEWLASIVY